LEWNYYVDLLYAKEILLPINGLIIFCCIAQYL
jgi:hypothetical protein